MSASRQKREERVRVVLLLVVLLGLAYPLYVIEAILSWGLGLRLGIGMQARRQAALMMVGLGAAWLIPILLAIPDLVYAFRRGGDGGVRGWPVKILTMIPLTLQLVGLSVVGAAAHSVFVRGGVLTERALWIPWALLWLAAVVLTVRAQVRLLWS